MSRERSQQTSRFGLHSRKLETCPGILYIVGVPIGNPADITVRALATLRSANIVASESPEATQALLQHHGIHTTVTSYGPVNLQEKVQVLIQKLREGDRIALVSDCGSPVVSDPGSRLIRAARTHAIRVLSVPGPSAVTAAVAAVGLTNDSWIFGGQLPDSKTAVRISLVRFLENTNPTVLFCTAESLSAMLDTLVDRAPKRLLHIACNLTMPDERILRGSPMQIRRMLQDLPVNGAITFIMAGKKQGRKKRSIKKRRIT